MISKAKLWAEAKDEARRFLGGAIEHRRKHPLEYYLFHERRATAHRLAGRRLAAKWSRFWREFWKDKALASDEAAACKSAVQCIEARR